MAYEEKISEKKGIAVNNFGIGLDAAIVHATNHSSTKKRLNKYNLGSFSYLFSILRALFTQKGFPILVDAGGKQLNFSNAFLCTATKHPFLAEESRLFQLLMRLNQSLILSWSNESISLKSCGSFFYLYRKNN